MYVYSIWFYNRQGRGEFFGSSTDFVRGEMLARECWRIHGNAKKKIREVENSESNQGVQKAESVE